MSSGNVPFKYYIAYMAEGCIGAMGIGYVFYNSFVVAVLLLPLVGL